MINIDGKQIKLQIWDTVRVSSVPHLALCLFWIYAHHSVVPVGRPGVVPIDHAELLPRRGRRTPCLRHHQARLYPTICAFILQSANKWGGGAVTNTLLTLRSPRDCLIDNCLLRAENCVRSLTCSFFCLRSQSVGSLYMTFSILFVITYWV